MFESRLYGRIAVARAVRPQHEQEDLLFLATEKGQFSLLGYDREGKVGGCRGMCVLCVWVVCSGWMYM